ncbi:MAG TPA: hypothetical protein VMH84_04755 [Xanthobacteraceae bacterium]|nr:hypothetical protein [Xanthobacteraceae bacterium]
MIASRTFPWRYDVLPSIGPVTIVDRTFVIVVAMDLMTASLLVKADASL